LRSFASIRWAKAIFAALKTSLDHVCSALSATAAAQEASTVSEQLESLGRRLDALARRPEPQPANLDPITEQLTLLTERMAGLPAASPSRATPSPGMMERLSAQMQAAAGREAPSQETLIERFDRIERELQQLGQRTDTAGLAQVLHAIDEKLERAPARPAALDDAVDLRPSTRRRASRSGPPGQP
jgi:localization factor PodJL